MADKTENDMGLTPEQMEYCRQSFRMIDENGNGKISASELERASQMLGYNPTRQEVLDMIASVDDNGNGQIEFPEFVTMMRDRFGALDYQERVIKDAFERLDIDKNGYVTYDELRTVLLQKGEPLTEDEFERVINQLDANHDGIIEYEELAQRMCDMSGLGLDD